MIKRRFPFGNEPKADAELHGDAARTRPLPVRRLPPRTTAPLVGFVAPSKVLPFTQSPVHIARDTVPDSAPATITSTTEALGSAWTPAWVAIVVVALALDAAILTALIARLR